MVAKQAVKLLVEGVVFPDRAFLNAGHQVAINGRRVAEPALARVDGRDVQIQIAIVVDVGELRTHAIADVRCAGLNRNVGERAVAVVLEQSVAAEIVRHVNVLIAVFVVVAKGDAQCQAAFADAGLFGRRTCRGRWRLLRGCDAGLQQR